MNISLRIAALEAEDARLLEEANRRRVRHVSRAIGSPLTWCGKSYAQVADLGESIVKPYQVKEGNCPYCHVEVLNSLAVRERAHAIATPSPATGRDVRSEDQSGRGLRLVLAVFLGTARSTRGPETTNGSPQ